MKFGVREICDVVLKAKANQKIGNKIFYKDEPVLYFDTLKTSSLEGTAETVYATGGRGNTRLAAWEGERTVTFTMEDALISPIGFSILSGAGLIDADDTNGTYIFQHIIEQTDKISGNTVESPTTITIELDNLPATYSETYAKYLSNTEDYIYVMPLDSNGEVFTEPFIATLKSDTANEFGRYEITVAAGTVNGRTKSYAVTDLNKFVGANAVLVDYYVAKGKNAQQIDITPDKFGGTFYLEASTLFRDANTGVDMPAEFIIPKCKIQSNFTFTMASTGDPSTFTFTMDAFPDYTRFDKTKKVLAAIQLFSDNSESGNALRREDTYTNYEEDSNGLIYDPNEKKNNA